MSIARENLLSKVGKHVGLDDIDFESGEFNREFMVKSADREFAFKLIDAEMMQYLLGTAGRFVIEVHGSDLLVRCGLLDPAKLTSLFDTVKGVRNHIPRVVWTEYGSGPPAAQGASAVAEYASLGGDASFVRRVRRMHGHPPADAVLG